jgi:hypothetical protein
VADVVEIRAETPAEFAARVADVDAIITSCGLVGKLERSGGHFANVHAANRRERRSCGFTKVQPHKL